VEDAMAVEVVSGIENRVDDNNSVVLCKLALCEDAVKQLSTSGKFKGEIVFCTRLKALVKLDLGWVRMKWVSKERDGRYWGGQGR